VLIEKRILFFDQLFRALFHVFFIETSLFLAPDKSYYTADSGGYTNANIAYMKKILEKLKIYKIHIRSWLIFIPVEIAVVGLASGVFGSPGIYFVHYILNILLFYLCGDLVYPLVFKKKFVWFNNLRCLDLFYENSWVEGKRF